MGNSQEGDCAPLVLDDAQSLINLDTKKFRICVLIFSIVGAEVANQDNWNSTCHSQLLHLFQVSIDLQVQMNHKLHTNQLNNWEDAYLFSLTAKLYWSIVCWSVSLVLGDMVHDFWIMVCVIKVFKIFFELFNFDLFFDFFMF